MSPQIPNPVRAPAVAGMFYPDDPARLTGMVQEYLDAARAVGPAPKALIAPHAGYVYSGAVAASAYARIRGAHRDIRRVVLLGPSHRVPLLGLAASGATHFDTPLGPVAVDREALQDLTDMAQVRDNDEAHRMEHSLEVHVPFLQRILDGFTLVPLVVGEAGADEVAAVLDRLWGGPETLIVVSSDLSHFLDYENARRMDQRTTAAIEALDPSAIDYDQACGRNPVNGLLVCARQRGLRVQTVDVRNSGDTAGSRDRVVGYGAYVFH